MMHVMKAGQWLTHENGEFYARAIRDIPYHAPIMSDDFETVGGGHPLPSSAIPEDVIRYDEAGHMHVNIDGEWNDLRMQPVSPIASNTPTGY